MKRVGVCIEWDRAWGRCICEGICAFAQAHSSWSLALLKPADFRKNSTREDFDGFITHMPDRFLENLLGGSHGPVVDLAFRTDYDSRVVRGIWQDNAEIGRLAARHFLEHRFTRFAFCGYDGQPFSDCRRDSFIRNLGDFQQDVKVYSCSPSVTRNFTFNAIYGERLDSAPDSCKLVRWLKSLPKPIALFCANDLRGLQVILACRTAGISVPNEIAVLGVDNDTLICNFIAPTLSSIDPDATALGLAAAKSLDLAFNGKPVSSVPQMIRPRDLIARTSTDIFPLNPPWLSDALVFIRRNITHHISAADVCASVGRSHTSVNASFRRELGTSVQGEIRRVALDRAVCLLLTTDLPAAEIARRTGFRTPQYFCSTFAKVLGKPPGDFRATHC